MFTNVNNVIMKQIENFIVVENKRLSENISVLTLQLETELFNIKAGQFVEVRIDKTPGVMLRRPISVHDVNYGKNQLKLLVQNVGKGSDYLCNLTSGTVLNLIYPLGNSFVMPEQGNIPLLIGGGCGMAPLLYWGRQLLENNITPLFLIGARNADSLIQIEEFQKLGQVLITTEDGSKGHKGFVVNHPVMCSETPKFDIIYTCGPEGMMKAVAKFAAKHGITCFVSLENRMACGIGACLCCVVSTIDGHKCTCVEGPVFNSKYIQW